MNWHRRPDSKGHLTQLSLTDYIAIRPSFGIWKCGGILCVIFWSFFIVLLLSHLVSSKRCSSYLCLGDLLPWLASDNFTFYRGSSEVLTAYYSSVYFYSLWDPKVLNTELFLSWGITSNRAYDGEWVLIWFCDVPTLNYWSLPKSTPLGAYKNLSTYDQLVIDHYGWTFQDSVLILFSAS